MSSDADFIKDGEIAEFFLGKVMKSALKAAMRRPNGVYFIRRRDFNLRMAQTFKFPKKDSRTVMDMLVDRGIAHNYKRGVLIHEYD